MQGGTVGNSLVVDAGARPRCGRSSRTALTSSRSRRTPYPFSRHPLQDAGPPRAGAESPLYVDLPGLVETLAVPGFEDAPVAIAVLEDGTQLVLNRAPDGSTRVAGTYSGTFPRVQVEGDWAVPAAPAASPSSRRSSGRAGGR